MMSPAPVLASDTAVCHCGRDVLSGDRGFDNRDSFRPINVGEHRTMAIGESETQEYRVSSTAERLDVIVDAAGEQEAIEQACHIIDEADMSDMTATAESSDEGSSGDTVEVDAKSLARVYDMALVRHELTGDVLEDSDLDEYVRSDLESFYKKQGDALGDVETALEQQADVNPGDL